MNHQNHQSFEAVKDHFFPFHGSASRKTLTNHPHSPSSHFYILLKPAKFTTTQTLNLYQILIKALDSQNINTKTKKHTTLIIKD